jgi:hypothetical protein
MALHAAGQSQKLDLARGENCQKKAARQKKKENFAVAYDLIQ